MKEQRDRFGVNMGRYLAAHEAHLAEEMAKGRDLAGLLRYHELKIAWLQHERLVHLIALALTVAVFITALLIVLSFPGSLAALILLAAVTALMAAYILHYFYLENRTQSWYKLYDEIYQRIKQ